MFFAQASTRQQMDGIKWHVG